MTVSLLQKRIEFTRDLGDLIQHAFELGYAMVICETLRPKSQARWNATHCRVMIDGKRCEQPIDAHRGRHAFAPIGIEKSLHCNGLAADFLIIMEDGAILNRVEEYERLGNYWKDLRPGNCWGGDFTWHDLGHFSREHNGRK